MDRRAFLRAAAGKAGLATGAFALGLGVDTLWARAVRGWRLEREDYPRMVVGGWRIHHNVIGWALLVVGLFYGRLVLIPLGLGMIVGHRIRDRLFWFAERAR